MKARSWLILAIPLLAGGIALLVAKLTIWPGHGDGQNVFILPLVWGLGCAVAASEGPRRE